MINVARLAEECGTVLLHSQSFALMITFKYVMIRMS